MFHRHVAVDQFIGHNDGYSMNTNNYRVYFDPSDGKADLLPWDLDYSFLQDSSWGLSWYWPSGNITYACFQDAACQAGQRSAMREFLEAYEAVDWSTWLDEVEALTYDHTQTDPRRECAATEVQTTRDSNRVWLESAPSWMRGWWGL